MDVTPSKLTVALDGAMTGATRHYTKQLGDLEGLRGAWGRARGGGLHHG